MEFEYFVKVKTFFVEFLLRMLEIYNIFKYRYIRDDGECSGCYGVDEIIIYVIFDYGK